MEKYYRFPLYPLSRVINFMPGDIIFNSLGDVYKVNKDYQPELKSISPLYTGLTMEKMTKQQYVGLYVPIINNIIDGNIQGYRKRKGRVS